MIQQTLSNDLRQLDVETFEIAEINDLAIDAPAVVVGDEMGDDTGELSVWSSSSCSTSSCCSCSTSSCCSTSTSTSSCG